MNCRTRSKAPLNWLIARSGSTSITSRQRRYSRSAFRWSMIGDLKDRGAAQFARAEFFQRDVGFFKRESFGLSLYASASGELEKFFAVAARQVGDRSDGAFVPKIDIWKRGDVAHVNPAAND